MNLAQVGGGPPIRRPIAVALRGSATDTSGSTSVTVPNVTVGAGDILVVAVLNDGFTQQGDEYLRSNVTWGPVSGVGGTATEFFAAELHTTAPTSTTITVDSSRILSSGTNDLVVDWTFSQPSNTKIVVAMAISGLAGTSPGDFWYFLNQTNTEGNDSTPAFPPVLIRRAESAIVAALGITGPSTDTEGAWSGGFVSLIRLGASGSSADRVFDVGYRVTSAIATYTAGKAGITARPWLAVPAIFDRV